MNSQAIKYETQVGKKQLNLYYHDDTLWFTLNNISELFNCSIQKVYTALKQVTKKNKITQDTCNRYIEITTENGKKSKGNFYNLDIIIAIGYMLNPKIAMEFYNRTLLIYKSAIVTTEQKRSGFLRLLKDLF
jgi:DNA ligase (NAD+)